MRLSGMVGVGGAVLLTLAAGQAQAAPPISIFAFVQPSYRGHPYADAGSTVFIAGVVRNGRPGQHLVLKASTFPFARFAAVAKTSTKYKGRNGFAVRPKIATRYEVALSSNPASTSSVLTLYVISKVRSSWTKSCGASRCTLHMRVRLTYPHAAVSSQESKPFYFYVGVRYGSETVHPRWLKLVGERRQEPLGGNSFDAQMSRSFSDSGPYYFEWRACIPSTESKDGFGLPGRAQCGAPKIRAASHFLH